MKARRVGDFVEVEWSMCICGHDLIDHGEQLECDRCDCDLFEDEDPDADYHPGFDEDEEGEA